MKKVGYLPTATHYHQKNQQLSKYCVSSFLKDTNIFWFCELMETMNFECLLAIGF